VITDDDCGERSCTRIQKDVELSGKWAFAFCQSSSMRILLTGAGGQVGTEVRRRFRARALLTPDRSELDLSATQTIPRWLAQNSPELILNVGAYTAVDKAEDESDIAFRVNRDAVHAFAEYADAREVPLIHLSTDYVHDGSVQRPYVESDVPRPGNVYGASKLAGEVAAGAAKRHLILRVSWVFSAHGSNFVRTMLRLGAERDVLRVVGDQHGGPTWAGHLAEVLCTLAERIAAGEKLPSGTWNWAGQPHVSWCEFARCIFDRAVHHGILERAPRVDEITTADYPTRARRPANSRLDSSLAVKELGLAPPDWREGLEETLKEIAAAR